MQKLPKPLKVPKPRKPRVYLAKYLEKEKIWRDTHPENIKQYYIKQNLKRSEWRKVQKIYLHILL